MKSNRLIVQTFLCPGYKLLSMDIFNNDLVILQTIINRFPRRVNERRNYFEKLDNLSFFKTFRMYKETVREILQHR